MLQDCPFLFHFPEIQAKMVDEIQILKYSFKKGPWTRVTKALSNEIQLQTSKSCETIAFMTEPRIVRLSLLWQNQESWDYPFYDKTKNRETIPFMTRTKNRVCQNLCTYSSTQENITRSTELFRKEGKQET